MLKSNIDVFCDVISLLAPVFIVSFDRAYTKRCLQNNIKNVLWLSFCDVTRGCDCTFKKQCTVPVTLTVHL